MPFLSAVLCVHNEEKRLQACLQQLRFADEIIVLLDRCSDGSKMIARAFADRVISGDFPFEDMRKMAATEAASCDWILEVDADELVSQSLAEEIRTRIENAGHDYFHIPVDNYVGNRLIRYGWGASFGTSSVARLYRRGTKSWGRQRVHPKVKFSGRRGPSLVNAIRHEVDEDISDMLMRLDRYTQLHALDLIDERAVGGIGENAFRGFRRFYKCFVRRKGYREGGWGVLIALMAGLYPFLSTLRAHLELRNALHAAVVEPGVMFGSKKASARK